MYLQCGEQGARLLAADSRRQGGPRLAVRHQPPPSRTDQVRVPYITDRVDYRSDFAPVLRLLNLVIFLIFLLKTLDDLFLSILCFSSYEIKISVLYFLF